MKIPLRKLRANLDWYTATERTPPPKIWRKPRRPMARAEHPRRRIAPLRAKRWRTAPRSLLGTFLIIVIVGVVVFVLLHMLGLLSSTGTGSEGNRVLRGMGYR